MYVSQKIRDQVTLQRFREALTGVRKGSEPALTLKDFGVTDPVKDDDLNAMSGVFGKYINKEHHEEEHLITGKSLPADEAREKKPSILARMISGNRSDRASRAETVTSRSSSSISYETPEHPHKEIQVSKKFHDQAMDPANNADPNIHDVNAVQMVLENVFDWDFHERHHGDTVTPKLLSALMKSLKTNLKGACPSVSSDKALELFEELGEEGWLGDVVNLKYMTTHIIEVYLEAQNGHHAALERMERFLQGAIKFNQRFYAAPQEGRVPMRVLAAVLEKQGGRPVTPPAMAP